MPIPFLPKTLSRPLLCRTPRWGAALLSLLWVWVGAVPAARANFDEEARAVLFFRDADPREVLSSLAEQLAIDPPPEYRGEPGKKITVNLRDVTLQEAMDRIGEAAEQVWWRSTNDRFIVGSIEAYEQAKQRREVAQQRLPQTEARQAPAASGDRRTAGETAPAASSAPEPAPVEPEPTVTVVFAQGKIEAIAMALTQQTGVRISLEGKTAGLRVDVIARDLPLTEVLDMIATPRGLVWWKKTDGSYGLADKAYYEQVILPESAIQRIFRPNHIKAEDFEKAIKGVLTQKIGKVAVDPRTNKVIVTDLPPVIEMIERLLQEIDVQLVTRVFQIYHSDVEEIARHIEEYKSGPGTIKVDPRSHQIIVTDLLQNILRMEKLIDVLDIGPEIVVYDVNNIGLDGREMDELRGIIDSIRTKDLLFETNQRQGLFILEDVPQIHDKVEKILKAFDQPMRQVLIEAEILTTSYTKEFSYSFDWIYSRDLFGAAADGLVTLPGKPGGHAAIDGGYRNLDNVFPLLSSSAGEGRGISAVNLTQEALLTLQLAMSDSSTNVLLQPQLLVKNMESARIIVGREEPYLTTFFNQYGGSQYGGQSVTQNFVPSGLEFELTPSVAPNGLIEMEVRVRDNDASIITHNDGTNTHRMIRTDRKEVDTILIIPSGETRVIGGLLKNSRSDSKSGIPFLSDIPIIGPLFGGFAKKTDKSNLMIFLTPSIVEERGTFAITREGRRGRALLLDEALAFDLEDEETPSTPTLALPEDEDWFDDEDRPGPAQLSDVPPDEMASFLLGTENATAPETPGTRRPRTSSYTATVGSPVGSLTDVTGAVTTTAPPVGMPGPELADSPDQTTVDMPEGERNAGREPPPQQPPRPTPAPATAETDY